MSLTEYRNRTMKNYALTLEYKHLQNRAPGGVYVLPYGSLRLWTGVIFIRQGVYRDGIFKFKIIIPANYPADNACPSVIFDTPVFHPLVNPETGELDLTKQFPSWKEGRDSLILLLIYVKKIFYLKSYDIEGAVNKEAAEIFRNGGEKKTTFVSRIARCVSSSLRSAYDEDEDSAFAFSRFKPEHQKYFDLITEKKKTKKDGRVDDEKEEPPVMKTPQKTTKPSSETYK